MDDDTGQPEEGFAAAARPRGRALVLLRLLVSLLFIFPMILLIPTASKPGARAAYAVKHGSFQMDNEEGALLYQAMEIRRGNSIYHQLNQPPYIVGTYTPLFMTAAAALDRLEKPSFATGRLIVWIAAVGAAALLIAMAAIVTQNPALGLLNGILFMATYEVYRWIAYFRVDFPALFLSLAGLAVVVIARPRKGTLPIAAALMVAAIYTKQTMIAAPAAVFLALLFWRWRQALAFAGYMLIFGIIPAAILQWRTAGQFLQHIITYNMNTFSARDLHIWLSHAWNVHRWLVLSGAVALPWLWWQYGRGLQRGDQAEVLPDQPRAPLHRFWQPLAWYAVLAQWNIVGAAKAGSAENYLLEPLGAWTLMLCVAAGAGINGLYAGTRPVAAARYLVRAGVALGLLVGIILQARFLTLPFAQKGLFSPFANPGRADFQAADAVEQRVREAKNPLSELAIYHLEAGKPPVIQPFIMSELARQHRWDQTPFVDDIKAARFDVVVALQDLTQAQAPIEWTHEMLAAFRQTYVLKETISGPLWTYYIMVPKEPTDEAPVSNIADAAPAKRPIEG